MTERVRMLLKKGAHLMRRDDGSSLAWRKLSTASRRSREVACHQRCVGAPCGGLGDMGDDSC